MKKKMVLVFSLFLIVFLLTSCGKVDDDQDLITPEQPAEQPSAPESSPQIDEVQAEEEQEEIVGDWVVDEEALVKESSVDQPGEVIFIREEMEIEGAMCLPVSIFSKKCVDVGGGKINLTVSNGLASIQGLYFKIFSEEGKTGFEHFIREVAPRELSGYVIDINKWEKEFGEDIVKVEAFPEIKHEGDMKVCINKKLSFNPTYSCKLG